ncbi:Carboxypeptidase A4 [Podila verticillata]|nr:Carboxypeptidase A4 [Podila verticillata]
MCRLWSTTTLALSWATLLCAAYPQPQLWSQNQQIPFSAHHPNNRLSPTFNNHQNPDVSTYARFDDEQVLRVDVTDLAQLKQLEQTVEKHNLDLWSNLRIGTVDVRVPASKMIDFKAEIWSQSSVMIPNLQELISEQPALPAQGDWNYTDNTFWASYHDMATLNNFTESMIQAYPKLVSRVSIGQTYEGREIFGMSIRGYRNKKKKTNFGEYHDEREEDDDGDDDEEEVDDDELEEVGFEAKIKSWWSWLFGPSRAVKNKPSKPSKHPKAIIIHAGQHAREWIGPAVATYIAKELILGYPSKKKIRRLVDRFEFIIVPVLNADGYVYTWENNRMWRKNRQPTSVPFCPGIDPNRNWGYLWNTGGSSPNPCNEGYHGPEAFSAQEAKMMADFITNKKNVIAYLDFHAYSQSWMSPFGADCAQTPKDDEDIIEGGMVAAKALRDVHNKKFVVGRVCSIIQQASGGSIDWTYAEGNVKYSYSIELRDTGRYGFLLPESEILPSSEETMAGVASLASFIHKREKQWGYMV